PRPRARHAAGGRPGGPASRRPSQRLARRAAGGLRGPRAQRAGYGRRHDPARPAAGGVPAGGGRGPAGRLRGRGPPGGARPPPADHPASGPVTPGPPGRMSRMRAFFRLSYLVGFKPWDSGLPPPELVDFVEGEHRLPPGRALDLGCGTGTNVVYLARNGWEATGVDFVGRAIAHARRKASSAGVTARLLVGDVTRLGELGVDGGHRLLLDL